MTAARFDLIVFDFDGTLADSAPGIAACLGATFEEFGFEAPPAARVRPRIGLTLDECIRQLLDDRAGSTDVSAMTRRYRELHWTVAVQGIALFGGADAVLEEASASGIQLTVVSQKGGRALRQLLARFDIERCFDVILGGDDVTAQKPDAALFARHVAPHCGDVAPDRVLVVGDAPTDLQFARNIGAASCWAAYGYGDASRCLALDPNYRIGGITELPGVWATSRSSDGSRLALND